MFDSLLSQLRLRLKVLILLMSLGIPLAIMSWLALSLIAERREVCDQELEGVREIRATLDQVFSRPIGVDLAEVVRKVQEVADQSRLSLDPYHTTYHLGLALSVAVPQLASAISEFKNLSDASQKAYRIPLLRYLLAELRSAVEDSARFDALQHREQETLQELVRDLPNSERILQDAFIGKRTVEDAWSELARLSARIADELRVALQSRRDAEARLYLIACGVILFSIVVLLGASWVIVRNVTGRIVRLRAAAHRTASSGDLTVKVLDAGKDEIGDLTRGFNSMVSALLEMTKKVRQGGVLISTSSAEIAAVSRQQQATSAQIAATTTEIEATSRRIAQTSQDLAADMKRVQQITDETSTQALDGQQNLDRMRTTMHGITEACGSISSKLAVLNQQAASIGAVVTAIAKVADQTNLLSLNAAIEAEKAGEYGHGFAVVAREIRRLADQTATSTVDIEKMVREIQGAVASGVMSMEKFASDVQKGASEVEDTSAVFTTMIQQIQTLGPTFVSVTDGMEGQAQSALQITESLTQLGTAARQTADSLSQSNQSIEQLHQATLLLQEEVQRFDVGDRA